MIGVFLQPGKWAGWRISSWRWHYLGSSTSRLPTHIVSDDTSLIWITTLRFSISIENLTNSSFYLSIYICLYFTFNLTYFPINPLTRTVTTIMANKFCNSHFIFTTGIDGKFLVFLCTLKAGVAGARRDAQLNGRFHATEHAWTLLSFYFIYFLSQSWRKT